MNSATRVTVSTFGTLMGLAGIEHGIGEILQGNRAPESIFFPSWPDAEFFRVVAGEPAMSIVPNLLLTGILAILFSLGYIAWATFFIQKKRSGFVMMFLSICMLLAGGGFFPPLIGLAIAGLATQIHSPLTLWRKILPRTVQNLPAIIWKGSFAFSWICWLTLLPGINILSFFLGINDPALTMAVLELALGSLLLTVLIGIVNDAPKNEPVESPILSKEVRPVV